MPLGAGRFALSGARPPLEISYLVIAGGGCGGPGGGGGFYEWWWRWRCRWLS